jgi:hypothetical protein
MQCVGVMTGFDHQDAKSKRLCVAEDMGRGLILSGNCHN